MGTTEPRLLAEELPAEPVGVVHTPVGMAEHEVLIVVAGSDQKLLLGLASAEAWPGWTFGV